MSSPANPLDKFATYTYQFELHASPYWQKLELLMDSDANAMTNPTEPNDTLLINTRVDAHQTIDDVVFNYFGASVNNNGQFFPGGELSFKVQEPNGVSFISKIANLMSNFNVTTPNSLLWALKIFFVGRLADNTIETLPRSGMLIPLTFKEMESTFTFKGGEYMMHFVTQSSFAGTSNNDDVESTIMAGYCNKNVTVAAKTVKEALQQLEQKLNDNYAKTYQTELKNAPSARSITYKINIFDDVDGALSLIGKDSYAEDDHVKLTFHPSQTIITWIFQILRSSDELNKVVGASLEGIKKQDHPGVKFLVVLPRYLLTESNLEIIYDIGFYEGSADDMITFDFLFAEPGKNVDILGFDIHMNSALAWFSNKSTNSVDHQCNSSSTLPTDDPKSYSENACVPNQAKDKLYNADQPYPIPGKKNDIAWLNATSRVDMNGYVKYRNSAVPGAKLMFSTLAQMHSAYGSQVLFTIRGNLDILQAGILYPHVSLSDQKIPFGIKGPKWLKVNIMQPDQTTPFFYTGKYNVVSLENHFTGGKFVQVLNTLMMDEQ